MNTPSVVYEDEAVVIIDKPAGWVVHEGSGEIGETVVDWYIGRFPEVLNNNWPEAYRTGIVHRLDKGTSGVMVLAKSPAVLTALQQQFKDRAVQKVYCALTFGVPDQTKGHIETYIGRHSQRRQEQTVLPLAHGEMTRRLARTEYAVTTSFMIHDNPVSFVTFYPQTGRMHQLRVHAKFLGTPILGDAVYTTKPAKRLSRELDLRRQLLHARSLRFRHPTSEAMITVTIPLASDMTSVLRRFT